MIKPGSTMMSTHLQPGAVDEHPLPRTIKTWAQLILEEMSVHSESWDDVVATSVALTERQKLGIKLGEPAEVGFDIEFDAGFGGTRGCAFTVWTERRVYFPAQYSGAEWCQSVPRHPNGEACEHVGSG